MKGLMDYFIESNEIFIINEKHIKYRIDLRKRLFEFAANVIQFLMQLPLKSRNKIKEKRLKKKETELRM